MDAGKSSKGIWAISIVSLILLVMLMPSYLSLAEAAEEIQQLKQQVRGMSYTVTVQLSSGTTTYTNVTNYVKSDNGTVSFTNTDDSTETEYVYGHGQYILITKILNT